MRGFNGWFVVRISTLRAVSIFCFAVLVVGVALTVFGIVHGSIPCALVGLGALFAAVIGILARANFLVGEEKYAEEARMRWERYKTGVGTVSDFVGEVEESNLRARERNVHQRFGFPMSWFSAAVVDETIAVLRKDYSLDIKIITLEELNAMCPRGDDDFGREEGMHWWVFIRGEREPTPARMGGPRRVRK